MGGGSRMNKFVLVIVVVGSQIVKEDFVQTLSSFLAGSGWPGVNRCL